MLNITQVEYMSNPAYSWYGLTNQYNPMLMFNDEIGKNYTYSNKAAAFFYITLNELHAVMKCLEYARSDFLFESPVITLT